MILPKNDFKGNSDGEDYVWIKCCEYLPEKFVSFHNYMLGLKQVDQILLVPNLGVLFIEIKGIKAKNIFDVPDNSMIRMKDSPQILSPLLQARSYFFHFKNNYIESNNIDQPYIIPVVCYPFINYEEYIDKNLNTISAREITILKNDFISKESFLNKISEIFSFAYKQLPNAKAVKYGFKEDLQIRISELIDPNFETEYQMDEVSGKLVLEATPKQRDEYSILMYLGASSKLTEKVADDLIEKWQTGTKIMFYSSSKSHIAYLRDKIVNSIFYNQLKKAPVFEMTENGTFLFTISEVSPLERDFTIRNGENINIYKKEIDRMHNVSTFNKDQYEIEHAELENIIVRAGAGTGKTFSIISRINYLIWKNRYSSSELQRKIVMITFTNESADTMRIKLSENFLNYFRLTRETEYLSLAEKVENMNIATIHSISKKLISKFSPSFGLGKDFKITTGKYKKEEFLRKELDELLVSRNIFPKETTNYILTQRLLEFMEKIDNKNIDLISSITSNNFGRELVSKEFDFISAIRKTQELMFKYSSENNNVCLGDLIKVLKILLKRLSNTSQNIDEIDFLFVDEFQDTDDIQIEIMKDFQRIFKYKMFVVGDTKQCIYRFRGAEVKAFDTLKSEENKKVIFIEKSLSKNYRTYKKLLDTLNNMFSIWDKNSLIEYNGNEILTSTKIISDDSSIEKVMVVEFDSNFISELCKRQDALPVGGKIAILVRYNREVQVIKKLCEKNKIAIDTEVGGELFKIDPTIDFYKLILALRNNTSSEYLYNLYTTSYTRQALSKCTLSGLNEIEIVDYFYQNLPVDLKKWNEYLGRIKKEPVLKVLRDIVEDVQPWRNFAEKIGATTLEDKLKAEQYYIQNLDQLFEKLILASKSDYITINRIYDYLDIMILTRVEEQSRASFNIERSTHNIICTTVHKSKGLEFDTVILPFTGKDISDQKYKGVVDIIFINNEIGYRILGNEQNEILKNDLYEKHRHEEEQDRVFEESRILYVALTRTIRKLVVFSSGTSWQNSQEKITWESLIRGGVL